MDLNTPSPDEVVLNPGTPEYDAAMVAKFEESQATEGATQATQTTDTAEERPGWLPEKFKSPEDLAKAYAELEKKVSQPKTEAPTEGDEADKVVQAAGLNMDDLQTRYMENGQLEEADYEALAKVGISRDVVDSYIAGQEALVENIRLSAFNQVGGEDNYRSMVMWASQNLTQAERDAYDAAMDDPNPSSRSLAIAGLHAKWTAAVGSEPMLLTADTGEETGDVFRSAAELTAAMRDPRYRNDPAYRADVVAKVARSSIL